ncbi:hypothetical protein GCM10010389_02840 [Streptomyces echinoruber]|uniref:Uncharacterized protein n=1 Tax=Streptomyces echinoruber TaxID=68898 RepID=A0A918QUI0_9ACTN|nr:hypothetical protein GCM10010389_02840 [Streptomyces echinoruber]
MRGGGAGWRKRLRGGREGLRGGDGVVGDGVVPGCGAGRGAGPEPGRPGRNRGVRAAVARW